MSNGKKQKPSEVWTLDKDVRRIPTDIIEKTGCQDKRSALQKYGLGAVFERTDGKVRLVKRGRSTRRKPVPRLDSLTGARARPRHEPRAIIPAQGWRC